MKQLYCSLNNGEDNRLLLDLIRKDKEFQLVDLSTSQGKVTIIVNSPLTELANLLLNNWKLKEKIDEILLVGGSDKYGDVTPVAEKNIYDDANAAQQVFISRIPIVMFGLNITRDLNHRALLPYVYLKNPSLFETEECGVYVETKGIVTKGMTITDLYSDKQFEDHDVKIVKHVQTSEYAKILEKLL